LPLLCLFAVACSTPTTGASRDGGTVGPPIGASSSSSSGSGSSSGATTAQAEVAVAWSVQPGTSDAGGPACPIATRDSWSIANPEANPLAPVTTGGTFRGEPVTVTCEVASSPSFGGYVLSITLTYGSAELVISGAVIPGTGPVGSWAPQQNITGQFGDNVISETFSESDCTVSFTANPNMGISAGRVWGTLVCPHVMAQDGTTCAGEAEFLAENCWQ
jgi:hypothetical protein